MWISQPEVMSMGELFPFYICPMVAWAGKSCLPIMPEAGESASFVVTRARELTMTPFSYNT